MGRKPKIYPPEGEKQSTKKLTAKFDEYIDMKLKEGKNRGLNSNAKEDFESLLKKWITKKI